MALTKAHFRMIEGSSVNVRDFGAVGDGITDDTAAIQAAIDYAKTINAVVIVPYGDYLVSTINLPDNNINLRCEPKTQSLATFVHSSTTGKMFTQQAAPVQQQHSIIFENIRFEGHASRTTSVGVWISENVTTGAPFNIRFYNCFFDNFAVGVWCKSAFYSHFERMQFDNCDVGFYGADSIDNVFLNCVPRTTPANGIGIWINGVKTVVISGDTGAADSGAGAYQYLVGNDVSVTVPTNASSYITAAQETASVTFIGTHFEFSDMAGLGTIQAAFVRVGSGSTADFNECHFMNRTPNLPCAVEYNYLISTSRFVNCTFPLGPANTAPGNGSYAVANIDVTSRDKTEGNLEIIPSSYSSVVTVNGAFVTDIVTYNVPTAVRAQRNSTQTVAAGSSTTVVTFGLEDYDKHNEFASNTFTATHAGLYQVNVNLQLGGANPPVDTKFYRVQLNKSGTPVSRTDNQASGTGQLTASLSDVIQMDAGDTLQVLLVNTDSGAPIDIGSNSTLNNLSIVKVG